MNTYLNISLKDIEKMVKKIKSVPMSATKNTATLGCPSGFSLSLPDELTSCWHNNYMYYINLNVSIKEYSSFKNCRRNCKIHKKQVTTK
ncbi:MAG: hypothetical protein ACOCUU_01860 [Nanoarchaeota archaeon]